MAGSRVGAVVTAAVSALAGDAALSALLGGPKAYTHVPQGTDPPYVVVLGGDEAPFGVTLVQDLGTFDDAGDSGGRQVDVVAHCISVYRGTDQVDAIASQVLTTLTDEATWTVTALPDFSLAEFVRNTAQLPTDLNGVLWFQRVVTVRVSLL